MMTIATEGISVKFLSSFADYSLEKIFTFRLRRPFRSAKKLPDLLPYVVDPEKGINDLIYLDKK